ncbi:MAG: hypothetical protein LBN74_10010 [Prevotella sp.]|jgi:hypothetical protein|nr:hypothetical protein [Prevotella sp.]
MKKNIFISVIIFFYFSIGNLYSQDINISEPDFMGEVLYVNPATGTGQLLEKSPVQLKSKLGASAYIVGIGSAKTRMTIKGCCSSVRIHQGGDLQFIIKAVDNKTDPLSIIKLFRMESKKNERRAEVASVSTFGGSSSNNLELLPFVAKKYGESSYLITISRVEQGEYGAIVLNPNALDEKATIISCFGVD